MRSQEVFQNIESLLPHIRERRDEIEKARKLPRDLVDRLTKTGVFRLGVPEALGGDEAAPRDLVRACEMVATADGSAGWCTMLGVTTGIAGGYMPEAGAKEVFSDPSAPQALIAEPAGAAQPADGGLRLSGRWKFASGITHSDWITLGCMEMDGDKPRMTPHGPAIAHAVVPAKEIEIYDTWYVSGLCGTGSFDVSCEDVFVPKSRVFSLFDPTGFRSEALYQVPVLVPVATTIAAVGLGIARTALDELTELVPTKTPAMSLVASSEKPTTQVGIARAEGELGAARAFMYEALDDLWKTVQTNQQPTLRQRSLLRIAAAQATEVSARVARAASTLGGGSAVYSSSDLQRHARDADVITHHMVQSPHVWEDADRTLLGFDPLAPVF